MQRAKYASHSKHKRSCRCFVDLPMTIRTQYLQTSTTLPPVMTTTIEETGMLENLFKLTEAQDTEKKDEVS